MILRFSLSLPGIKTSGCSVDSGSSASGSAALNQKSGCRLYIHNTDISFEKSKKDLEKHKETLGKYMEYRIYFMWEDGVFVPLSEHSEYLLDQF